MNCHCLEAVRELRHHMRNPIMGMELLALTARRRGMSAMAEMVENELNRMEKAMARFNMIVAGKPHCKGCNKYNDETQSSELATAAANS